MAAEAPGEQNKPQAEEPDAGAPPAAVPAQAGKAEPAAAAEPQTVPAGAPKVAPEAAPPGKPPKQGAGQVDTPPSPPPADASKIEALKLIGGLLALVAGLVALIVVVVVALLVKPDTTGGSIATTALGVLGSMVGAYFGVKIGTDGTKTAINAQQEEATKAQAFALHTPPGEAKAATAHAQQMIEEQNKAKAS